MGLTLYLTQMKVCPISRCASWSDYDPWLRPDSDKVGIRNAEIHIVISRHTGEDALGEAIESVAHELRHFSFDNRQMGNVGFLNAESNARVTLKNTPQSGTIELLT